MKTIPGKHNGHKYEINVEYAAPPVPGAMERFIVRTHFSFDGVPVNPNETIWHEIIARFQRRDEATLINCAKAYIDAKWGEPPSA